MAKIDIHSSATGLAIYSGKPVYNGSYGGVSYLEFRDVAVPDVIEWAVGDYVDYERTGLRYKIYNLPQPKKQARVNEYGAAIVYPSVILHDATKMLELTPMQDLVQNDNYIHFSSRAGFSTFENVQGIAARLQAVMGEGWRFEVYDSMPQEYATIAAEARQFEIGDVSVLDALNHINEVWEGIGWVHTYDATTSEDVITIGRASGYEEGEGGNVTDPFAYGRNNGLKSLKRNMVNLDDLVTVIYAYGSEKNMPYRYYNRQDIYEADSMDLPNLMLPKTGHVNPTDRFPIDIWGRTDSKHDASKAKLRFLDLISRYGAIAKVIRFDGGEHEEIYPTLQGMTFGQLRTAIGEGEYYPSETIYPNDGDPINRVKVQDDSADNGLPGTEDGKAYVTHTTNGSQVSDTFSVGFGEFHQDSIVIQPAYAVEENGKTDIVPRFGQGIHFVSTGGYIRFMDGGVFFRLYKGTQLLTSRLVSVGTVNNVWVVPPRFDGLGVTEVGAEYSIEMEFEITANGVGERPSVTISSGTGSTVDYNTKRDLLAECHLTIKQIGFDIMQRAALSKEGNAMLVMTDGMCGGREFQITNAVYQSATDDWKLTIKRTEDGGTYYPNTTYHIKAGDAFVLTGISMPDVYVEAAEQRLLMAAKACAVMPRYTYEPEIDAKYMALNHKVIREGMYMLIEDDDIEEMNEPILITSLTIDERAEEVPTYRVTLKDN